MRKAVFAVAVVIGIIVLLFAFAPAASAAGTGIDLEHVCTLDSGKEKFTIENQTHKSQSVRLVTAFHDERYGVDEGQTIKVRARVSQGSYPIAKLRQHGEVIDRERAHYNPC